MDDPINLYFDESGFTGGNLLDLDQPYFFIGSHDVNERNSELLLKDSFPDYIGSEFKFGKIFKSKKHRNALGKFLLNISNYSDRYNLTFVAVGADKRFVVFTKIMEYLVEPSFRIRNYNFYGNRYSKKYANYNFSKLSKFYPEKLETLIQMYHKFSLNPQKNEAELVADYALKAVNDTSFDVEICSLFKIIYRLSIDFDKIHTYSSMKGSNDLHLTTMVSSISNWRNFTGRDIIVNHDASSNFYRKSKLWNRITSISVDHKVITFGSGASIIFPLRVRSTVYLDSKENFSIQLSDMIAGLCCKLYTLQDKECEESMRFCSEMLQNWPIHVLGTFHSPELYHPGMPPKMYGKDSLDQFGEIISGYFD